MWEALDISFYLLRKENLRSLCIHLNGIIFVLTKIHNWNVNVGQTAYRYSTPDCLLCDLVAGRHLTSACMDRG